MFEFNRKLYTKIRESEELREFWDEEKETTTVSLKRIGELKMLPFIRLKSRSNFDQKLNKKFINDFKGEMEEYRPIGMEFKHAWAFASQANRQKRYEKKDD